MRIFRTPSLGDSISVALRKLLRVGWRGSQTIFEFAAKEEGSLNIKIRCHVKEFSFLCMVRCKPQGSLNYSFHVHLSSFLFNLRSGRWGQKAVSCIHTPAPLGFSAINVGVGGIFRISVWRVLIHICRPESLMAVTSLVYWYGRGFHFTLGCPVILFVSDTRPHIGASLSS